MKLTFGFFLGIAFLILTIAVLIEQFILMYNSPKRTQHGVRGNTASGVAVSASTKQH